MQPKKTALWIAGLISIGAMNAPVLAQNQIPPESTPPLNVKVNCRSPQTQSEMNFCAAASAKVVDRQLNQTYQKAIAKFKGTPQEKQLVNAQLVWIKFRDADCAFSQDRFRGGTIAPLVYSQCVTRLSQQRLKDLEGYLTEGGF